MLSAPPRIFFRDLLYRLDGKMQGALPARDPFEKGPEIESRQKSPLALEHFDRQIVAVIEHRIGLARQAAKPRRVLVLHPQAQDPNGGRSRAGHPYSILKTMQNMGKTVLNTQKRLPLSLAGLNAGVSREELE
jgi:hypothetical protein